MEQGNIYRIVSIVYLCVLWCSPAGAADDEHLRSLSSPLTLEQAVAFGLKHNPVLRAAEEELKAAMQGIESARADFLPRFDVFYRNTQWEDEPIAKIHGIPGGASQFQTSDRSLNHWQAEVRQPLFEGFGLKALYEMAKEERNIADSRRLEARLNLVRAIQQTFIRTLLAEKVLGVAREDVMQLGAHLKDAEAFHRQGLTPLNDVLRAEVALADAKQRERDAAQDVSTLRLGLNRLLGIEGRTDSSLAEWDKMPESEQDPGDPSRLERLLSLAEHTRPEIFSLAASIREAEQGERFARSAAYPHLFLFGTYYREGDDFWGTENDFTNDHNAAVGVRMDWNWFEGGKTKALLRQWRHKRDAVIDRQEDLLKQVRIEVKNAYEELHVAGNNLATSRVAIKQAEESLRITNIQYREQVVISLPLYVQTLLGYTAVWAGFVLGPGGIASLLVMPFAGILMKKGVNARTLLAVGLSTMAYSLWLMGDLNLEADFYNVALPRIVQGLGIGLFFVPLSASTYANIPKQEMGNASGIFNLLRNLGGSFGVAASATLLSQRSQFHQNFLVERVTPFDTSFQVLSENLRRTLPGSGYGADAPVLGGIYREVLRQANMLAFNDIFWLFAWFTIFLVPLTFLMKRPSHAGPPDGPQGVH